MKTSFSEYQVVLFLSMNANLENYDLKVGDQTCNIFVCENVIKENDQFNLVITDKNPEELTKSNNITTALIINKISNTYLEQQYENIFPRSHLKYKSVKIVDSNSIKKIINGELIKNQVKDDKFNRIYFMINPYTRGDFWKEIVYLSWLLVPFAIIIIYLTAKYLFNFPISFLCWFVEYEPDCIENKLQEFKLLALLYSIFNFVFYYNYILSIYDNINNDVFQFTNIRRLIHKALQFLIPIVLFSSVVIIFKELFVFRYELLIFGEYAIKIGLILNKYLVFLNDSLLIYYFIILDLCLLLVTLNFFKADSKTATYTFSTKRQENLVRGARKSFGISLSIDIVIWFLTFLIFSILSNDPQIKLVFQLILLQAFYLYINISTIFYDFHHK